MSNEIKIIIYLLRNKEKELNIRQIARGLRIDYKNVYSLILQLQKKGILTLQRFGKSWKILLNNAPHPLVYEAEYQRKQEILKNKDLLVMLDYFHRHMKTSFYVLLLFGSYAKRTNTKNSDIDLLFIVPNELEEKYEQNIQHIASLLPLKLHLNIFKEKDFLAMKNSKELTIGSEAIKNNILLHGIEEYYELLNER